MEIQMTRPKTRRVLPLCDEMLNCHHILIAGCVGSGKSVLLQDYIYNILCRYYPDEDKPDGVQIVLIDPKRVDYMEYLTVPHFIRHVTENKEIISTLDDVINTMENRYRYMQQKGLKKYDKCNLVVIVDELADLMTTNKKEVLPRLQRIAQLGRAAKIKLVCATQAPARKVIPAELTLNFTGKIALHCESAIESRQVIGMDGAEKLPKNGKCLFKKGDGEKPDEYYIPMFADSEYTAVIEHWKKQVPKNYKVSTRASSNKRYDEKAIEDKIRTFFDYVSLFIRALFIVLRKYAIYVIIVTLLYICFK